MNHYQLRALQTCVAMAHMDWLRQQADHYSHLKEMRPAAWARFTAWEAQQDAMQYTGQASAYWIAHRLIAHLQSYFRIELAEAMPLIDEYVLEHGHDRAFDTVLSFDDYHNDPHRDGDHTDTEVAVQMLRDLCLRLALKEN